MDPWRQGAAQLRGRDTDPRSGESEMQREADTQNRNLPRLGPAVASAGTTTLPRAAVPMKRYNPAQEALAELARAVGDDLSREEAAVRQAEEFVCAADALLYEGEVEQAKVRYGRAIDAFLDAGRYEAAMRTCRTLIRIAPDVVRTRYTLGYLLVGCGSPEEAEAVLWKYVRAVQKTRAEAYAVPRLGLLAHVTEDPALCAEIGAMLRELGTESDAEQGLGWANPRERWAGVLPIVLRH